MNYIKHIIKLIKKGIERYIKYKVTMRKWEWFQYEFVSKKNIWDMDEQSIIQAMKTLVRTDWRQVLEAIYLEKIENLQVDIINSIDWEVNKKLKYTEQSLKKKEALILLGLLQAPQSIIKQYEIKAMSMDDEI